MVAGLYNAPGAAAVEYRPISNDCSAGYVTFTFDDGPDVHTPEVMNALLGLNLKGVFFVTGAKVAASPAAQQIVRDLAANGFTVQNHTWDHKSLTGESTGTQALDEASVRDQMDRGTQAIMDAGLPSPTSYRPPFGDINSFDDLIAQNLGLRIVMSWSTPTGNIIDSKDWAGATAAQIVSVVTQGRSANGYFYPAARDGTIIAMHDGQQQSTLNTLASLQPIVDWMNTKHLCSTTEVRQDATGNVIPPPAPPTPSAGNLVGNSSLETLRLGNTPASEPVCFQQGGASTANTVTNGLRPPMLTRAPLRRRLTSPRGDRWGPQVGPHPEAIRRQLLSTGRITWRDLPVLGQLQGLMGLPGRQPHEGLHCDLLQGEWQLGLLAGESPLPADLGVEPCALQVGPLPAGATAVSYGLAIQGVGSLITDDYVMTASCRSFLQVRRSGGPEVRWPRPLVRRGHVPSSDHALGGTDARPAHCSAQHRRCRDRGAAHDHRVRRSGPSATYKASSK